MKLYFCLFIFLCLSCSTNKSVPSKNWDLLFYDDFTEGKLDSESWNIVERGASWNNEDQAYTKNNVKVKDGFLVITSKKEEWMGAPNLQWHEDNNLEIVYRDYTSGLIDTKGKKSWKYCKVEVRAKMETTSGMLNAIWMVPDRGSWPPEIDIAEILGNEPNKIFMTNHYGSQLNHRKNNSSHTHNEPLENNFHIYGIEWDSKEIRWYLDGEEIYKTSKGVPHEPFYLILCPAIGPDWTGNPSETSVFPLEFKVDWVKVYQ